MNSAEHIFALDPAHPNYIRWQRAIDTAVLRGELVAYLLSMRMELEGKIILDVGTGVGGTTFSLEQRRARVHSIDINPDRLRYVREKYHHKRVSAADAMSLPLAGESFDAVILQDVIEHVPRPDIILREIFRVLKPSGLLYLSTPNRFSPMNIIADPHWGLPLISLCHRSVVRFILHRLLRREMDRLDFAELLSFTKLRNGLTSAGFHFELVQSAVTAKLFDQPSSVVWSNLHLSIIRYIKLLRLDRIIRSVISNEFDFINRALTPSWYLICTKR